MLNPLQNAGLYLIQIVFELYIMVLIVRLILHVNRADFYNPLSQMVAKLTTPVVKPLQKILPTVYRIDLAVISLILLLEVCKISMVFILQNRTIHHFSGLFVYAIGDFLDQLVTFYFYAILIQIILSWVKPSQYNPAIDLIYRITSPLMGPAQRLVPAIGGVDLSPIPVMIGLKLFEILLTYPVMAFGQGLALLP